VHNSRGINNLLMDEECMFLQGFFKVILVCFVLDRAHKPACAFSMFLLDIVDKDVQNLFRQAIVERFAFDVEIQWLVMTKFEI
jgi:hypothetical protein